MDRARAYLSGDLDAGLDAGQLRQVVAALVAGAAGAAERALALLVLQSAGDAVLGEMFADGGLAGELDAGFPPGEGAGGQLRADLERFYEQRFGPGQQAAVAAGTARPLVVYPAGEFSPGLLGAGLADLGVADEVPAAQARAALYGRGDAELEQRLEGVSPAEAARAARWIARAREAAGWADRALRYLTGDLAVRLNAGLQRRLATALVTGWASEDERWLALHLLRAASDEDLKDIFEPGLGLLPVLEEGIPAGHGLRPELDSFLQQRFSGGPDDLAAGRVLPHRQPAGRFTPELLDPSLKGLAADVEPAGARLDRIAAAIRLKSSEKLSERLRGLPLVERARAARWLTAIRVALHAQGTVPGKVLATLERSIWACASRNFSRPGWRPGSPQPPHAMKLTPPSSGQGTTGT
ncbi:MAG TPA: hypothetical protein VF951_05345 [Streptosporangiaceae bacterium]